MSDLLVRPGWTVPEDELSWRFSRSSGPGGQGVNTTDSRATVSFDVAASLSLLGCPAVWRTRALDRLPAVVVVTASEHRSQLRNRSAALERLTTRLREATMPPPAPRRKTKPSRGAVQRRLDDKKRQGAQKAARQVRRDD